jgi:hypothetical protein
MVNWVRGRSDGPYELVVEDDVFSIARIPTHLQLHADISGAKQLAANDEERMAQGVTFGHGAFRSGGPLGFALGSVKGNAFVRPFATGDDMLRGRLETQPDYCIYLADCVTEDEARASGGPAFEHLKRHVYPMVRERAEIGTETKHYEAWIRRWWQPRWFSATFATTSADLARVIACGRVQARGIICFLSTDFVANDSMKLFALDDDYSFGIIQSGLHWAWTKAKGGKVRADIRYTNDVWRTFPWPQEPTEDMVAAIAAAGRELRRVRDTLMKENGWSLRALHQAAEIPGPHPLKSAQAALDDAVKGAYGMPADQEATEFLLELNKLVAEDETEGRKVQGPGLPAGLDPKDPRWTSNDCIEPPA